MQWRKISRKAINEERWQSWVSKCPEAYYHDLGLLDALGVPFEGFVYGAYEACFPVFFAKKFGVITYAYQPILIQRSFVPSDLEDSLIKELKHHYFHFDISLITEKGAGDQLNMILPIGDFGKLISKSRAVVSRMAHENIRVQKISNAESFEFLKVHLFEKLPFSEKEVSIVRKLLFSGLQSVCSYAVTIDGEIHGVASIYNSSNRCVYLKGTTPRHAEYRELGTFLLKHIIENRNEQTVFDFGGSMTPGVATFFRKFNPKEEYYKKYTYFKFSILEQLR